MPPLADNSSITCCTSREPPSPDALSPRYAKSPIRSPTRSPKKSQSDPPQLQFSSVSSLGVAGLHSTILSDEKADAQLVSDESTSTESREEMELETRNTTRLMKARMSLSSLNLNVVTKNLKKHLSRDSALNKRRSRSSVGHSEEEVERRAELRRIRQRRIEEELSHESVYDDDMESSSNKSETSPFPDTHSNPRLLKLPQLSLPILSLPRLGSLSRNYSSPHDDSLASPSLEPGHLGGVKRSSLGTIQRRYSSPFLTNFELSFADPRVYVPPRKLSPIPPTPATPNLEPRRLPSIAKPDKSSWRLSFASPNRGEQLRRLSREYDVPVSTISDLLNAEIPPSRRWLHNRGLRSSSYDLQDTDTASKLEPSCLHGEPETRDLGGVDGPDDQTSAIPQHQIDIITTQVSECHQDFTLSLPDAKLEQGECEDSNKSHGSPLIIHSHSRHLQNTSESIPLSQRLPPSWGKKKIEVNMSTAPSTTSTFQQSPKTSRFHLISRLSFKKGKDEPREAPDLFSSTRLSSNATFHTAVGDATPSLSIPSTSDPRRSTIDDGSILASETESFREREAELKVVQARFSSAERSPSTPRSSKFREEFDFGSPSTDLTEPRERKLSAFARLTRFATRTFDGTNGMEDLLAVPMPKFDVNELPSRTPGLTPALSNPLADASDVSAQWGKAVKLTTESKAKDVGSHLQLPTGRSDASRKKSSFGWKRGEAEQKTVEEVLTPAAQYEKQFQERLAVKEMVMDDWEAEMEATAQKAKAKSRNIMKKIKAPTGPDNRFPPSWARFPSHSRSERSLSAGAPDLVAQHDFAMRISESGERIFHQCRETPDDRHIHDNDPDWHKYDPGEMGLAAKLGDRISQTVYHLEVHGGGSKPFEFQTDGRRGSMVLASKLEFPELELLPVSPGIYVQEDPLEDDPAEDKAEKKQIIDKLAEYGKEVDNFDGKLDDSQFEESALSIADPRFYHDCLIFPIDDPQDSPTGNVLEDVDTLGRSHTLSKSKSWHGRGTNGRKLGRGRNLSVGTMALRARASTDDYYDELVRLEEAELKRFLKSTELCWGGNR